jgi:hypothetical protein
MFPWVSIFANDLSARALQVAQNMAIKTALEVAVDAVQRMREGMRRTEPEPEAEAELSLMVIEIFEQMEFYILPVNVQRRHYVRELVAHR